MMVMRAYKTELDPTETQKPLLFQHAGAARVAYNWGLQRKIAAYKATGKSPTAIDLHREINKLKDVPKERGGFPWMRESSKCAPQEALRDLDRAFRHFFRRCKKKDAKKGFPRFKSRNKGVGSFRLTGSIRATRTHVQLPIIGQVRLKETGYLPIKERTDVRILSATISEKAGHWFVSLQVEEDVRHEVPPACVLGVDVGISTLATTSTGGTFANPRSLKKAQERLRRLSKSVSRKKKGSNNRQKASGLLARQHYRVSCLRRDAIHKATTAIAKQASVIVIEDLNVKGMLRNRKLSKALSDASLGEFHRQLEYKVAWRGGTVVKADRFFPSSKACSGCESVKASLSLGIRTYECEACGLVIDRDLNAAINLANLAVSSTVTACGEISSGEVMGPRETTSAKQEPKRLNHAHA